MLSGFMFVVVLVTHIVHAEDLIFMDFHTKIINPNCTNPHDVNCSDGTCIHIDLVCNDEFNCNDHSDEENCDFIKCRQPHWYQCHKSIKCIKEVYRCDGSFDCPENDDEDNCGQVTQHHEATECPDDEFSCVSDSLCLPMAYVCDGTVHCIDGSDETKGCEQMDCKGFVCQNKHCLTDRSWVCDGKDDCGDNSDETLCVADCKLEKGRFLCADNETCIPTAKVCDRNKDCPDAGDETDGCLKFNNNTSCPLGTCPQNAECFVWPRGPICICSQGLLWNKKLNTCEDINECTEYGRCSQGCINTLGSYRCTCIEHFTLANDMTTCEASEETEGVLLYAGKSAINGLMLRSEHQFKVTNRTVQVVGVTYDGHFVYWTDLGLNTESIVKAREDGSQFEVLLTSGLTTPEDIAVDWLTGNLYFTDRTMAHIGVCSNDGRHCVSLVNQDVDMPRSLALLPQNGQMFWSDWGKKPMIARSQMDGTAAIELVSEDINWPNGVTLDWPNDRLYWVDAKLRRIESVNMHGKDRRIILESVLKSPFGIAVFENNIYWSDWRTKSIQTCNKFNCKDRKTIAKDKKIYDVHIYHPGLQPHGGNPCLTKTCSHLCLLSGNATASCACPEGMQLNVDLTTCADISKKQYLLIGIGNYIITLQHRQLGRQEASDATALMMHIDRMALNTLTGEVFIADNVERAIYSVNIDTAHTKHIVAEHLEHVSAMSFDPMGNNLFWADKERGTVEVLSLQTKSRSIIHHYMGSDKPIALVVIPENGQIIVALRSTFGHTHFDRLSMHGLGSYHHMFEEGLGYGDIHFAMDTASQVIYWLDEDLQKISFTDYDGNMNHTFASHIDAPNALAVLEADVFWSTVNSMKLYWAPTKGYESVKVVDLKAPPFISNHDQMQLLPKTTTVVSNHICQQDLGKCSHICVPLGRKSACVCPIGMVFKDKQNFTCIEAENCDFRCASGECLAQSLNCDGRKDCADGSDELFCSKAKLLIDECSNNEFKCTDATKCIRIEQRCDLNDDCPDASDEKDCQHYNSSTGCGQNQFKCQSGRCIDLNLRCDGFNDCDDGEDELKCGNNCTRKGWFSCTSGQCIPMNWKCDGISDCTDSFDEHNCPKIKCPDYFFKCTFGQCIDPKLVCDGINHCGDHSDELHCNTKAETIICGEEDAETNERTMFQCTADKKICLDMAVRCNGTAECPHGEDEANCSGCRIDEFECTNKKCIRLEWRCDKANDCGDGSDEQHCDDTHFNGHPHHDQRCADDQFDCKDGTCLEMYQVCDQTKDCTSGLDESGMCGKKCDSGVCDQLCKPTPYGPVCSCYDGFALSGDKKHCVDIDECREFQPCAQLCQNTAGSFKCSCFVDYLLHSDRTTCKPIASQKFMLFNSFDTIYNITRNTMQMLWSSNGTRISGMDLNVHSHLLYFTLEDSKALFEFDLATKQMKYLQNVGSPRKLAVDWITNNVYVVDELAAPTLKICHMAEKVCVILQHFNYRDVVKALTIDSLNNRLFYTLLQFSIASSPMSIVRSQALDGSRNMLLVNNDGHISDLVCDPNKQVLFYADLISSSIWSVKYDGTMPRQLIRRQSGVTKPISIMLTEDQLYVFNIGSKVAAHCKAYADHECKTFDIVSYNAENLVIWHETAQTKLDNICAGHKCSSAVCVPAERGPKCLCHSGSIVEPGVPCKGVVRSEVGILNPIPAPSTGEKASVVGVVLGCLAGVIAFGVLGYAIMWAYNRKLIRRPFVARVHFQNPRHNPEGGSSSTIVRINAPDLCTSKRYNEIFLNDTRSEELSDATATPSADEERNFIYDNGSITDRLIRHNSK